MRLSSVTVVVVAVCMYSECLFGHKNHEWCRVDSDELLQREKEELQSILPQVEIALSPLAEAIGNINDTIDWLKPTKNKSMVT